MKMFSCSTEEREQFLNFVMAASSCLDNDMHKLPTRMVENKAQKIPEQNHHIQVIALFQFPKTCWKLYEL
jgi:hypothetical protein